MSIGYVLGAQSVGGLGQAGEFGLGVARRLVDSEAKVKFGGSWKGAENTDASFSPPPALPALQVPSLPLQDSPELTASLLSAGSQVSRSPCAHMEDPHLLLDKQLPEA